MAPAGPLLEVPTRKSPRLAGASRFAERLRCLCSSAFKRSRPLLIARCSAENQTGATGRFLASDVYGPWQRVIAICDVGIAGCSRLLVICPVVCSELDSSDCTLIERSLPPSTPTEPPKKPMPQKKAKTDEDEPVSAVQHGHRASELLNLGAPFKLGDLRQAGPCGRRFGAIIDSMMPHH